MKFKNNIKLSDIYGWFFLIFCLFFMWFLVGEGQFGNEHKKIIFFLGVLGVWRYSNSIVHYLRGMYFLHWKFPRMRMQVSSLGRDSMPSKIFMVVTSFRIPAHTTYEVYQSVFQECLRIQVSVTVVISIVEKGDEYLIKDIFSREVGANKNVNLVIVRTRGVGKREGLAHAFKAVSRCMPAGDAVVGVVDGDTKLLEGCIKNAVSFFSYLPSVGGITTDEYCRVEGGNLISHWHTMRFIQRHINMCSMALSRRVLTMTGRLSFFRAKIIIHPDFIADVREDHLEHWRLGRFKFLTGDDKSNWFNLIRLN